jgi:hypothetical protein
MEKFHDVLSFCRSAPTLCEFIILVQMSQGATKFQIDPNSCIITKNTLQAHGQ